MSGDDFGRKADLWVLLILVGAALISFIIWRITVHA
jgi:hypothetical protein